VLLTMGGQKAEWTSLGESFLPEGWVAVVTGAGGAPLPKRFVAAPPHSYIPDLVNAVDVVSAEGTRSLSGERRE
jgi:hypothetical protein